VSQIVLTSIYDRIKSPTSAGSIHALVSGRIYQLDGPQGLTLPALIFGIENNDTATYFGQSVKSMQTLDVLFTILFPSNAASAVVTAMEVEAAIFARLNRVSITPSDASYTSIETYALSRGVPQIDEDFIRIETTYRCLAVKDT
jgi:hypothetical protein